MRNPCYDPATKTDCPDRSPNCAITCPKWAKYKKAKNKEYNERAKHSVYDTLNREATRKQRRIDNYNRKKKYER